MLPRLGPLPFPTTYGLLVAAGLLLALFVLRRLAPRAGIPAQQAQDILVWSALAGLLGAKLLLVVVQPRAFLAAPWELLFQGGVFYGGLLGALATAWWLARRRGFDAHSLGDACAPAVALGHALGRLGCFLAGCCWGAACEAPWGVVYTHPEAAATSAIQPPGSPVHPVQLYEAGGNLLLALGAWLLLRRRRFSGQVWWSYVGAYALLRFLLEELRGDARGGWLGGLLSTSQGIALLGVLAALVALSWRAESPLPSPVPEAPEPAAPEEAEAPA